jgi:hypothetical protein
MNYKFWLLVAMIVIGFILAVANVKKIMGPSVKKPHQQQIFGATVDTKKQAVFYRDTTGDKRWIGQTIFSTKIVRQGEWTAKDWFCFVALVSLLLLLLSARGSTLI